VTLCLGRSLRSFYDGLRLFPTHLIFYSDNEFLADFDAKVFQFIDNAFWRGVQPKLSQCISDRLLLVGCHFGSCVKKGSTLVSPFYLSGMKPLQRDNRIMYTPEHRPSA